MPKFRRKPVVVEALQYFNTPEACGAAIAFVDPTNEHDETECTGHHFIYIRTEDGIRHVLVGDWIIKEDGKFSTCTQAEFDDTYEAVNET